MSDKISVFNTPNTTTETWTLQGAVVQWGTNNSAVSAIPMVLNDIQISYAVPTTTITPLNTSANGSVSRVIIKGTPEGSLVVQTIFSPSINDFKNFLKAVMKPCKLAQDQVMLTLRPFGNLQCSNANRNITGQLVFYMHDLDLRQMDIRISQQNNIALVQMPLQFNFTNLEIE